MDLINVSNWIPRCLAISCLATVGLIGHPAEPSPRNAWWHGDSASGQWGGLRDRAETRGVTFFADFTADNFWNTTGGLQTGHAYMGLLEFGVELDLEPLTDWWRGGTFKASGLHAHNIRGITIDLVGDLNGVSNIEAPEGTRLYELWLAQTLFNDTVTLQGGSMLADAYFAYNESAGTLVNAGFGWSQFIAANTGTIVPAFPFAALGARVAWRPIDQLEIQAAIFDGDSLDNAAGDIIDNPHGFEFNLDSQWFLISEIDWKLNHAEGDTGLKGLYRLGGFYHAQNVDDLYQDANGNSWIVSGMDPKYYQGTYAIYIAGEQEVFRENDDQGLSLFARAAGLPSDRSLVHLVADIGLSYTGAIPGRDRDVASAGIVYVGISDEHTRTEEVNNAVNGVSYDAFSDHEMVFEFTYRAQINNWWYVQPDVQYIVHPGGSAILEDSVVVGLRTGLSF